VLLGAATAEAGAEYDYTRRVAPPWVAFLIGWVMVLGLVIAAAAVSLGFASYLRYFIDVAQRIGAWALLGTTTLIALRGIAQSARLTVVLSLIQVGGLVAVIAIGLPRLGDHNLIEGSSVSGVVSAAALVFFAFVGFDEVITLSEETADPARTVPRALLLADVVAESLGSASGYAVAAAGFVAIGDLALVASVTDFAVYVVFVAVNLTVILLGVCVMVLGLVVYALLARSLPQGSQPASIRSDSQNRFRRCRVRREPVSSGHGGRVAAWHWRPGNQCHQR
jgi:APA family basic amino acid/polyamine antiporter